MGKITNIKEAERNQKKIKYGGGFPLSQDEE